MKTHINLTDPQIKFIESNKKFKIMVGGTGCGKSYVGICNILKHVSENPNTLSLVVMPGNSDIKNIAYVLIDKLFPKEIIKSWHQSKHELQLVNGSKIIFRSANSSKFIRDIYTLPISSFWIDNGDMVKESVWVALVNQLKQSEITYLGIITSTSLRKWMYQKFCIDKNKLSNDYLIMDNIKTESNSFLPDDYIETLKNIYHGEEAKREIDGHW